MDTDTRRDAKPTAGAIVERLRKQSGDYGFIQRHQEKLVGDFDWDQSDKLVWDAADLIERQVDDIARLDGMLDRLAGISDDNLARAQRAEAKLRRIAGDS
jgi:hypothetical protein